jgi:hypothetical protein
MTYAAILRELTLEFTPRRNQGVLRLCSVAVRTVGPGSKVDDAIRLSDGRSLYIAGWGAPQGCNLRDGGVGAAVGR